MDSDRRKTVEYLLVFATYNQSTVIRSTRALRIMKKHFTDWIGLS